MLAEVRALDDPARDHAGALGRGGGLAVQVNALRAEGERDLAAEGWGLAEPRERDGEVVEDDLRAVDLAVEEVGASDEAGHEARPRPRVERPRLVHLLDPPLVHDGDAVGGDHRLRLVVGDVDRRDVELVVEAPDLVAHLLAEVRVEIREGLVQQEHGRLHDDRARERDALLLPARELGRIAIPEGGKPHDVEDVADPGADLRTREAAHLETEGHVLRHRHVGPDGVALEDHGHVPLLGRQRGRGRGDRAYVPPPSDAVRAHPDTRTDGTAEIAAPEAPPPTTLVFKDGHRLEVRNYAIVGATMFDLTPGHPRKIELADVDLEATQKENEDGVSFQLPSNSQAN